MSVTLKEVAQAAGVSTAAVSKVLHGRGNSIRVSEARAQVIREAAERLNYYPNALARGLRSSRTHTVGLVFEDFGDISTGPLYLSKLLGGLGTRLFPNHYRLTILPEIPANDVLGAIGDGSIEGVVWCKLSRDEQTAEQIRRCPIPIVAFNAGEPEEGTGALFISCDNAGGIELAVEHLWNLGHRDILFVYEEQERKTPDRIARTEAFHAAMARRNAADRAEVVEWDWRAQCFKHWWAGKPKQTAIIGWTERIAAEILARAAEMGVSVPEDLSVVGFDSTPFCESTKPRLTAVQQPIFDMAQHAADVLLQLIGGQRPQQDSIVFPCTLDVRDSTSAPSQR